MMLGAFENFPENIHRIDSFKSSLSSQKLQQKLVEALHEVNRRHFSFEEINNPTLHHCTVTFEFGLAENESFNYLDDEEAKRVLDVLRKRAFQVLDFFLAIRYHRETATGKTPLKFDYYMLRFVFAETRVIDVRVFHERGPRYVSPEDVVNFVEKQVNDASGRKLLRKI
jgi:hypothetical protein